MFKRIATALVLITVVVVVLTWSPIWLFQVLMMGLALGGLWEFYRIVNPRDHFLLITGLLFGLLIAGTLIFFGFPAWAFPLFIGAFFILALAHMFHATNAEGVISKLGLILFGAAYLSLTLPVFVWLRISNHGRFLIVLTIAIVALGDSFAYAFGKMIGRHNFSPLISPKKTIEGFIASFFGGVVGAVICWQVFWPELPIGLIIFLGLSVALIGALGDLIESLIKRAYHVKDSGNILPGHGGILDRLDALLFAAPFVYFTFKITGWI